MQKAQGKSGRGKQRLSLREAEIPVYLPAGAIAAAVDSELYILYRTPVRGLADLWHS